MNRTTALLATLLTLNIAATVVLGVYTHFEIKTVYKDTEQTIEQTDSRTRDDATKVIRELRKEIRETKETVAEHRLLLETFADIIWKHPEPNQRPSMEIDNITTPRFVR